MKCKFCNKEINNKGSLVKHENGCKLNPNRKKYVSNFIPYLEKLRRGEVKRKYTNQIDKAKKLGIPLSQVNHKNPKSRKGCKMPESGKEKISFARSKRLEELGGGGFRDVKWYKIKNICGEVFIVRGKWELIVAKKLNESKIKWIRKIYLKYPNAEGNIRTYTPDFFLPKYNKYVEVKGYFSNKDKEKIESVLKYNKIKLILIREKDIKSEDTLVKKIIGV